IEIAGFPLLFHRYFDLDSLFYFVHPSWWEPRYTAERGEYEITDESDPAAFGSSLGWLLQPDGDRRRNELLNSPWVRVCLPILAGPILRRVEADRVCMWVATSFKPGQASGALYDSPAGARSRARPRRGR